MKRRLFPLALALALALSACGPAPAASTPEPEPEGVKVQAHWDALETAAPKLADRRYEAYTDTLIPADDYGFLVPYFGDETHTFGPFPTYLYGLATREGEIVTDPVYLSVKGSRWFDSCAGAYMGAQALILQSASPRAPGAEDSSGFEERYGICAADGSWYTGQRFSAVITQCAAGALCLEDTGGVVMLDYSGAELWRWSAEDIPLRNFEANIYISSYFECCGDYLRYTESRDSEGNEELQYVDTRSGAVYGSAPADFAGDRPLDGSQRYPGGRFLETGGAVVVRPDSGGEYRVKVPGDSGNCYANVSGDRVLFNFYGGPQVLTDLEGNELARWEDANISFAGDFSWRQDPDLLIDSKHEPGEDGRVSVSCTVYDRDGRKLLDSDGPSSQFLDRLLIVDGENYRLTDLEGNDLMRISRWAAMDFPAEE